MSTERRDWAYKGESLPRRVGEVYARFFIGGAWGVLLYACLAYLVVEGWVSWPFVAFFAFAMWGIEKSMPPLNHDR